MPTDAQRRNLASAHHAEVQALKDKVAELEKQLENAFSAINYWKEEVSRDVPAGWRDLLISLTEHAAEAGDHTEESFRRGVVRLANRAHKFLAAPQPQPVQVVSNETEHLWDGTPKDSLPWKISTKDY